MKHTLKKSIAVVLATLMLLTAAPLSGFVGLEWPDIDLPSFAFPEINLPDFDFNLSADAATIVKSGTCGTDVTYTLDSDGVLTIAGTGNMDNYEEAPWYDYRNSVKTIIIEDGITNIGIFAFSDCDSLTSVIIPESVTSIEDYAFNYCDSLTSVIIPSSVTNIANSAFSCCFSLNSITIPDSVISIGDYVFNECISLTSVVIPNGVTKIGDGTFTACYSLSSITIPDSVTSIGDYAFHYCTSLPLITIPDSVTSIGDYAFYYCNSLTSVYYSGREEEWNDIDIGVYNPSLLDATIYFLEHMHNYNTIVTPPTCTTEGYTTYTCECGDSYITDFVDAKHSLIRDTINTYEVYKCAYCDYVENADFINNLEQISIFADFLRHREIDCNNYQLTIDNSVYYSGIITKHNIDGLLLIAVGTQIYSNDYEYLSVTGGYTPYAYSIPYEDVEAMFFDVFGIKNVDFSMSQRYDVENEIFYDTCNWGWGTTRIETTYEEEQYIVRVYESVDYELSQSNEKPVWTVIFDETAKIVGIYFPEIPDTLPDNDHTYSSITVAPTCIEQGYTAYTCICGDSYVADYVGSLGHSYVGEITTPATHITTGVMTYTCSTCGDTYTEVIAKTTEHTYEAVVTAPTCTAQGYTTYTCECGDSYVSDYVKQSAHSEVLANEKAATATKDGYTGDIVCSVCSTVIEKGLVIPATGEEVNRCDHLCHKDGILGFFWKIIRIFQKLFGMNPVCECGAAHY